MKNLKSKNIFLLVFCYLFLVNCRENKFKKKTFFNDAKIDSLLSYSFNKKVGNNLRIKYADELFNILKLKNNDSVTRKLYFKLADRYYNLDKEVKFKEVSEFALKLSKIGKDSNSIAKSYKYLGEYHFNIFRNDSAFYYFTKSEKTYKKINIQTDLTEIKLYKSKILLYEKDFVGCEEALINVLKTALITKDNRLIYDSYITLGVSLEGLNEISKAIEYYNKALVITNNLKTDSQYNSLKAQVYLYLGCINNRDKNFKNAIKNFEKGLNYSKAQKLEPYLYANFINNLGYSQFKLGNKSAIYQLNKAATILDSLKNIPGIVSSKINLSEYYLFQKDSTKALSFANEAKATAHENKIFEDELKTLELLAKIDPKNNEFYNKRFIKLNDSLQNNERATRNKFARIEFETDEILNEKKTIEVEKDAISSQRWLILGASLLALIIGGLLYFTKMQHSRNKVLQIEKEQQKANEEIYKLMLDQQSKIDEGRNAEKKRISQELHDGIIGKLASIRLNLFVLKKKKDEETINNSLVHIDKIQDIENEIQAISRDLSKDLFATKDSFKIIIEELFQNQASIFQLDYTLYIDQNINWENIDNSTKMHLYRIFQESLHNIHKYAEAKNINAKISKIENNLEIEIEDDGKGFDVAKTKDGIGLKNMKSRSDLIKSELNIVSNIDFGTKISLIVPI